MKRWRCYYLGDASISHEGNFEEIARTTTGLTLRLVEPGPFTQYPERTTRHIPLGKAHRTSFCTSVRKGARGTLVVYHEGRRMPFIYDPA